MFLTTLFTAAGQFFLKDGTNSFSVMGLFNFSLIFGIILYGIGALLLIFALRHGELNTLYPMLSLTLIWVTLISAFLLHESITTSRIVGNIFILSGLVFITKGGK